MDEYTLKFKRPLKQVLRECFPGCDFSVSITGGLNCLHLSLNGRRMDLKGIIPDIHPTYEDGDIGDIGLVRGHIYAGAKDSVIWIKPGENIIEILGSRKSYLNENNYVGALTLPISRAGYTEGVDYEVVKYSVLAPGKVPWDEKDVVVPVCWQVLALRYVLYTRYLLEDLNKYFDVDQDDREEKGLYGRAIVDAGYNGYVVDDDEFKEHLEKTFGVHAKAYIRLLEDTDYPGYNTMSLEDITTGLVKADKSFRSAYGNPKRFNFMELDIVKSVS